jgi:hypothetical protein
LCNGSTTVFGAVCLGSNPGQATKEKALTKVEAFFMYMSKVQPMSIEQSEFNVLPIFYIFKPMKTSFKLLSSYLIALCISISLAIVDSDPIISYSSLVIDILFMSILIWGLGVGLVALTYGVKLLLIKKWI